MDISSTTGTSFNRSVTPTRGGSDRHVSKQTEEISRADDNQDQRVIQEKQQQRNIENKTDSNNENQRRLDGRLITLDQKNNEISGQELEQNRANYIRDRVKEAYSSDNRSYANSQEIQNQETEMVTVEAIDLVV